MVEFRESLDKERITEAWKKTRSQEPFLRARSEDKFVTAVPLENCQEKALKMIIYDSICLYRFTSFFEDPVFIEHHCFQKFFKKAANCSYDKMNKSPVPTDLMVVTSKEMTGSVGLIIRLPHSIADGTSMMIILHRVLYFYDHQEENVEVNETLPEPAENLLPEISVRASGKGLAYII